MGVCKTLRGGLSGGGGAFIAGGVYWGFYGICKTDLAVIRRHLKKGLSYYYLGSLVLHCHAQKGNLKLSMHVFGKMLFDVTLGTVSLAF